MFGSFYDLYFRISDFLYSCKFNLVINQKLTFKNNYKTSNVSFVCLLCPVLRQKKTILNYLKNKMGRQGLLKK